MPAPERPLPEWAVKVYDPSTDGTYTQCRHCRYTIVGHPDEFADNPARIHAAGCLVPLAQAAEEARCVSADCTEPAAVSTMWPGQEQPSRYCWACILRAGAVAHSMGFKLAVTFLPGVIVPEDFR